MCECTEVFSPITQTCSAPNCSSDFICDGSDSDRDGVADQDDECPSDGFQSMKGPCGCNRYLHLDNTCKTVIELSPDMLLPRPNIRSTISTFGKVFEIEVDTEILPVSARSSISKNKSIRLLSAKNGKKSNTRIYRNISSRVVTELIPLSVSNSKARRVIRNLNEKRNNISIKSKVSNPRVLIRVTDQRFEETVRVTKSKTGIKRKKSVSRSEISLPALSFPTSIVKR